ncbi:hypothetical protein E2C01_098046 [Portunus trituberculatus]|uniref:Uncharacterized protein n=1 Tax=Portunus trituberculatus TaxID=210409 RepID=A0A5B7K078_PORTR|nr:hypothetical protein [Portunus trituberculatus]
MHHAQHRGSHTATPAATQTAPVAVTAVTLHRLVRTLVIIAQNNAHCATNSIHNLAEKFQSDFPITPHLQ